MPPFATFCEQRIFLSIEVVSLLCYSNCLCFLQLSFIVKGGRSGSRLQLGGPLLEIVTGKAPSLKGYA